MQTVTIQGKEIHTDGSAHDETALNNVSAFFTVEKLVETGTLFEHEGKFYTPRAAFAAGVGPFAEAR